MTTITTSRLTLRPPCAADALGLVRALDNYNVSRWTARIPYPYGPDDAEAFFTHVRKSPDAALILFITRGDELIGGIGIERGELGYWLAEPHWGQGYGTEAARALIDHAFGTLGFGGVTAGHVIGNDASRRILLGLGFRETGAGKAFSRARQEEVPVVLMKLDRHGWADARERRR